MTDYAVHVTTDVPIDTLADDQTDELITALALFSGAIGGDTHGRLTVQLSVPAADLIDASRRAANAVITDLDGLGLTPALVSIEVQTSEEFDRWLNQPADAPAHTV